MRDIRIPKVGMSTIEVEVVDVYVAEGQSVEAGQVLMSVAADKVDLEIESDVAGKVEAIMAKVGDVREVGDVVARIEVAE